MKLATLLAGVAAATLVAGAASAQDIHKGQATGPISGITVNLTGNTPNVPYPGGFGNILAAIQNGLIDASNAAGAANAANANNGNSLVSSWHAIGNAVNNNGTAGNDSATFTLTGNVTPDCAYYSGDNNTETLNFGQIGIYASDDTGPAAAFTMVAPAVVSIDTNLAGCNTANTVRITKTNGVLGMVNSTGTGYDSNVFQANLPYSVTATYTAPDSTSAAQAGSSQTLIVSTGEQTDFDTHGAWKSAMSLDVLVPTPARALLAGDYSGSFTVTISAGI